MLAVTKNSGVSTIINRATRLMGNKFEISIVSDDITWAHERIDSAIAEVARVEKLLSTFTEDSVINEVNRNAGIRAVKVNTEIFRLVERALQISTLTHGTFDITYTAAGKVTGNRTENYVLTKVKNIKKKLSLTNYTSVELDGAKQTVFLKNAGMRIGFGSISRGYAADRAKYILQMEGVSSGVINAGGDLLTWGLQPDNTPWTIASADPSKADMPFSNVNISNMAVATSFNSDIDNAGVKTDINPGNGFPVSKIKSVSIITPGAELADAMATPIISMGINAGLYLINKLNQMACIIIDDHSRVYTSKDVSMIL